MRHARSRVPGLLVSLVLVAGASGCGGDSSGTPAKQPTTLDAAFVKRADAVCAPYAAYNDKHPFPYPSFNRYAPDVKLLPRIGDFFDRNPANHTFLAQLVSLGTPKSGATTWKMFVADTRTAQSLSLHQIAIARRADAKAFVRNVRRTEANNTALHEQMLNLGLPSDSACLEVF